MGESERSEESQVGRKRSRSSEEDSAEGEADLQTQGRQRAKVHEAASSLNAKQASEATLEVNYTGGERTQQSYNAYTSNTQSNKDTPDISENVNSVEATANEQHSASQTRTTAVILPVNGCDFADIYGGLDLSDVPNTIPLIPAPHGAGVPYVGIRYNPYFGWETSIDVHGSTRYLGAFSTPERAALVFARAKYKVDRQGLEMYEDIDLSRVPNDVPLVPFLNQDGETCYVGVTAANYNIQPCLWQASVDCQGTIIPLGEFFSKEKAAQVSARAMYFLGVHPDQKQHAHNGTYAEDAATHFQQSAIQTDNSSKEPRSSRPWTTAVPEMHNSHSLESKRTKASLKEIVLGKRALVAHRSLSEQDSLPKDPPNGEPVAHNSKPNAVVRPGNTLAEALLRRNAVPKTDSDRKKRPSSHIARQLPLSKKNHRFDD